MQNTVSSVTTAFHRAFNDIFQSQSELLVSLCHMLEGCQVVQCRRGEVDKIPIDCTRNDVVLVVATENQSRDCQILFDLTVNSKNFHLTFLSSENKLSLRHGDPFFGFWTIVNDGSRAQKDPTLEYQYNRVWKFLIHVSKNDLKEETKLRYLKYLGGQGIFFCREHELPLSTDYLSSNRKCSLPRNNFRDQICTRKSAWRCLEKNCFASVCKTHFRELGDANDKVLVDNTPSDDATQDSSDDDAGDFALETEQPEATMPGPSFVVDNQQRPVE